MAKTNICAEHLLTVGLSILIPFDLIGTLLHPSILNALNLLVNILILLYLVQFHPLRYFRNLFYLVRQ